MEVQPRCGKDDFSDAAITFSVIIPTIRGEDIVSRCLDGLADQTFAESYPLEVIVVDDGSVHPLCLDPLRWKGRFSLKVLHQKNSGPATARNSGAAAASGTFLAFTDDDCIPDPFWIEAMSEAIKQNPNALVGTATWNGLPENIFSAASQLIIDIVYDHNNRHLDNAHFLASNNFACARSHFLDMGGFDPDFPRAGAEDRDFCDRWRISGRRIVYVPLPLIEHRHAQTLEKYLDLHFRYGRGAYLYQLKGEERGVSLPMHPGFYENLVPASLEHLSHEEDPVKQAGLAAALVLWQVANTVGYFTESLGAFRTRTAG